MLNCITTTKEKETMTKPKNKLEELGFKKVETNEPGFHIWEMTPSRLNKPKEVKKEEKKA